MVYEYDERRNELTRTCRNAELPRRHYSQKRLHFNSQCLPAFSTFLHSPRQVSIYNVTLRHVQQTTICIDETLAYSSECYEVLIKPLRIAASSKSSEQNLADWSKQSNSLYN